MGTPVFLFSESSCFWVCLFIIFLKKLDIYYGFNRVCLLKNWNWRLKNDGLEFFFLF